MDKPIAAAIATAAPWCCESMVISGADIADGGIDTVVTDDSVESDHERWEQASKINSHQIGSRSLMPGFQLRYQGLKPGKPARYALLIVSDILLTTGA